MSIKTKFVYNIYIFIVDAVILNIFDFPGQELIAPREVSRYTYAVIRRRKSDDGQTIQWTKEKGKMVKQ